MLVYTIHKEDKKQTLKFPESAEELTLLQACKFENALLSSSDRFKSIETLTQLSVNELSMYAIEAASILSDTFDVDLNDFDSIATGKEKQEAYNAILSLYIKFQNLLSYRAKERKTFKYKSKTWIIPTSVLNVLTGKEENPHLSFNETSLLLQIRHNYNDLKSDRMNLYYKLLNMIAVAARSKDEKVLPLTDAELKDFQIERMKHFEDLPYSVALDFSFFLTFL